VGLICIPCEVMLREFDAKLLLAVRLASKFNHSILIGYDKYFNHILPRLGPVALLEKSMSSLMFKARIKPAKDNKGFVMISDEEGINDLLETPLSFLTRVDTEAWDFIDCYGAWGEYDKQFYGEHFSRHAQKIIVTGNCRSDLLNHLGRAFYSDLIDSINTLFGNFYLVSDNFSVDHFDPNYQPPRFNVTEKAWDKRMKEWEWQTSVHRSRRDHMAMVIKNIFKSSDFQDNIVIRPHPVYDSRFWSDNFSLNRRVSIILKHSADPWIMASLGVISSGCTLGLQAIAANKKSIHVQTEANLEKKSLTALLSPAAINAQELLREIQSSPSISMANKYWDFDGSSSERIAGILNKGALSLPKHSSPIKLYRVDGLLPSPPKWLPLSLGEVQAKINNWSRILSIQPPSVRLVSPGVFLLQPV